MHIQETSELKTGDSVWLNAVTTRGHEESQRKGAVTHVITPSI